VTTNEQLGASPLALHNPHGCPRSHLRLHRQLIRIAHCFTERVQTSIFYTGYMTAAACLGGGSAEVWPSLDYDPEHCA
jgi:hypothetical protein